MEEASSINVKMIKVAIVSFPWKSYTPYKFLSDILRILEPISHTILLIGGNLERIDIYSEKVERRDIGISMHYLSDIRPKFYSAFLWIVKCVLVELKSSLKLVRARKDIDVVIFYMAYPYHLLPVLISKVLRKRIVEVVTRSKPKSLLSKIISLQDPILFRLLDGISPESKALIADLRLEKYQNKLLPEGYRFIDFSRFTIMKGLSERKNIVGYIGRIVKQKGIVQFVKAIFLILKENKDVEFLIGGSGDLLDWVKEQCRKIEKETNTKVTITGFIKPEAIPSRLNELKLLVIPAFTEGLPTIMLEAMACGTPVLATPVGAIPDLIRDGVTGFIMEDNSPECIAKNILRVLNHQSLEETVNARKLIEEKYTYEAAVERYRTILNRVRYDRKNESS